MEKSKTKILSFEVSDELYEAIRLIAFNDRLSISSEVRKILQEYINSLKTKKEEK